MNDIQEEVRELLQRKAKDLPPHLEVPEAIRGRVRRRIALNVLAVGVTLALVSVGAFAGVRTFGAATNDEPAPGSRPTSLPSPVPKPTPSCSSGQLRAVGTMEGAAGSRFGT